MHSLNNRTPNYGSELYAFVAEYARLEGNGIDLEIGVLRENMQYPVLQFNAEEANVVSKLMDSDSQKLAGLKSNAISAKPGPALIQLFDFIATIDDFDNKLEVARAQIQRLGFVATHSNLRQEIMAPDCRPWGYQEHFPKIDTLDPQGNRMTCGQALGCPVIYDPGEIIKNGDLRGQSKYDPPIRAKTPNELNHDEAHLLDYTLFQLLYALEQGLFKAVHTRVFEVDLAADIDYERGERIELESGSWINQFHKEHKWVPVTCTGHTRNLTLLQAKEHDLRYYPGNRFWREYLRKGMPETKLHECYKPNDKQFRNLGGAIGMFYVTASKDTSSTDEQQAIEMGKVLREMKIEEMEKAMESLYFHPIHASANLGKAFRKTLSTLFRDRLVAIQNLNYHEQMSVAFAKGAGGGEPLGHKNANIAAAMRTGRAVVGPRMIPLYKNLQDKTVQLPDAYNEAWDGSLVLRPDINPVYSSSLSYTANAFKIQRKPKSKSEYLPVLYDLDVSGGWHPNPVEFYLKRNSKEARLIEFFTN